MASRRVNPAIIANPPAALPTAAGGTEFRSHQLRLPAEAAGLRFDQALARSLPQYSRARIRDWIDSGQVQVDGRPLRAKDRVLGGEQVQLTAHLPVQTAGILAEQMPLEVVHQDRAILVINKPPGLVVHPGAGNAAHTLQNALLGLDPKLALVPRAGLVHRLDKDTSGLLVIARTPEAHTALVAAMAARAITREYLALCMGVVTAGATIDEPIGRHRTQRTRMAVRADGRPSVTHYRVVRRFRGHTLLRVKLETGRTHQIRVHLAHAGFPVVGDPVYGGRRRLVAGASPQLAHELRGFTRQALHAAHLKLNHPVSGRELAFEAPVPQDLQRLLAALEADRP